jgi:hypothetical protein
MKEKKDLLFACTIKGCNCLWRRYYEESDVGSLIGEHYSREDDASPNPCRECIGTDMLSKTEARKRFENNTLRIYVTGTVDPRVHANEPMYPGHTQLGWTDDGTCSYCGSISHTEAIRLLKTPGAHFSGTDKTTYKAYIHEDGKHNKFYFRHLEACTDEELAEFDKLASKTLGLRFDRHEGAIRVRYPQTRGFYGWQTYGVIGPDGEPVFKEGSPKPPPPEFWEKT